MDSVTPLVCVMLPEFPVIVSGYVPIVTAEGVVTVKTVVPLGISGLVSNDALAPTGNPDTFKFTDELNPFVAVSWIVKVMD